MVTFSNSDKTVRIQHAIRLRALPKIVDYPYSSFDASFIGKLIVDLEKKYNSDRLSTKHILMIICKDRRRNYGGREAKLLPPLQVPPPSLVEGPPNSKHIVRMKK